MKNARAEIRLANGFRCHEDCVQSSKKYHGVQWSARWKKKWNTDNIALRCNCKRHIIPDINQSFFLGRSSNTSLQNCSFILPEKKCVISFNTLRTCSCKMHVFRMNICNWRSAWFYYQQLFDRMKIAWKKFACVFFPPNNKMLALNIGCKTLKWNSKHKRYIFGCCVALCGISIDMSVSNLEDSGSTRQ